jgi:hypothetical protein
VRERKGSRGAARDGNQIFFFILVKQGPRGTGARDVGKRGAGAKCWRKKARLVALARGSDWEVRTSRIKDPTKQPRDRVQMVSMTAYLFLGALLQERGEPRDSIFLVSTCKQKNESGCESGSDWPVSTIVGCPRQLRYWRKAHCARLERKPIPHFM